MARCSSAADTRSRTYGRGVAGYRSVARGSAVQAVARPPESVGLSRMAGCRPSGHWIAPFERLYDWPFFNARRAQP